MKMSKPRLESLEARIVMTVPTVASFAAVDSALEVGDNLQLEAIVDDVDNDVQRVDFYLDDGDGVFDAAVDQLIAADDNATDGWHGMIQTAGPYRIMPLGDSITQARAPRNSYRAALAEHLDQAGYNYDFVGTVTGPNTEFDSDHEGHWGWRAEQILERLPDWLEEYTPDIVLLHLGTNDALHRQSVDSTIAELDEIVENLRSSNPNVVIMTSLLIPTVYVWNNQIDAFNAALPAAVERWNTAESPVLLVDQNSAIDPVTHLYDGLHPNELGEQVMADVWFEHIEMAMPLIDPDSSFSSGSHTLFAVATDSAGNVSRVSRTSVTIGDVDTRNDSIVALNASQELWVGRSNGTTLDTAFGGAWASDASFTHVADGDVNGDGYDDLIGRQTDGRLKVALGNRWGGFRFADWGKLTNIVSWSEFHVADFNGDGMDDFAARADSDGTWWVGTSTGSSFSNAYWGRFPVSIGWTFVVGDFNADGRQDLAGRANTDGTWWTASSTQTASRSRFLNQYAGQWNNNVEWTDIAVGDFNGDGTDDIAGRETTGQEESSRWWISASVNGSFATRFWTRWNHADKWEDVLVGDFNGDGIDDVASRGDGRWWIATSTQQQEVSLRYWGYWTTATTWDDVRVIDVNGDGMDDIVGRAANGEWWNFESQGGSFKGVLVARWASDAQWQHVAVGSFA